MSTHRLYIAIPLLDEFEYITDVLNSIRKQTFQNYKIYICVNQPDKWWQEVDKREICERNQKTIEYLQKCTKENVKIIDRSSQGKGWTGNKGGVGLARKIMMDEIANIANPEDYIVSLDADTTFGVDYFQSVIEAFSKVGKYVALSVPYYHNLRGIEKFDRAILRYEIYMRYYALNMWRICSPYSYTALGSAMVIPVWAYISVSGITPHKSGEDFYFLQKLRKFGKILHWCDERVYPSPRISDRVGFGTGPAIKSGIDGNWSSYPIYAYHLFDNIKLTFKLFHELYDKDLETPMSEFLVNQFNEDNIWDPLRKNSSDVQHFVRACREKVDGLRQLQYLKIEQQKILNSDEELLIEFLDNFYNGSDVATFISRLKKESFEEIDITILNELRNFLMEKEDDYRRLSR